MHGIYGGNGYTTVIYSGEMVKGLPLPPPADGYAGGKDVVTYAWSGEYLKGVMYSFGIGSD